GALKNLPEGAGQKIVARGKDGSVDVEVTVVEPPSGSALPRPYAGKADMKLFLATTPIVVLDHPRVKAFGEDAVGGLVNSLRSARMIEVNVHNTVQLAPANIGWGNAPDVLSSQTGDSTEASVLAVAAARGGLGGVTG